jgi:hypothetical protein
VGFAALNPHYIVIASDSEAIQGGHLRLDCFRLRAPRFGGLEPAEAQSERRRVVVNALAMTSYVPVFKTKRSS